MFSCFKGSSKTKKSPKGQKVTEHKNALDVRSKYKFGKTLGKGAFSTVKLVVEKSTGKEYACKMMELPKAGEYNASGLTREDIFLEINILCGLNHVNVIKFIEFFEEENRVYIICDLLRGGELLEALIRKGSYTEEDARLIFVQLLTGIQYLHQHGVVHRDLKMENLLLTRKDDLNEIKIADFGLAKKPIVQKGMQTICGSPQYVAPEILAHTVGGYGSEVDLWSAGVVLYSLLLGFPPFFDKCEPRLFKKIQKGAFPQNGEGWNSISKEARDIIKRLLIVDPKKRMKAEEALRHPWLTNKAKGNTIDLTPVLKELKDESFREKPDYPE
eukprot:1195879-Prorocentrum_minimum.AAC.4